MPVIKKQNVLIVEDDKNLAKTLELTLKSIRLIPECSNNGLDGLNKALDEDYELVILDVGLPRLSGLKVASKLLKYKPSQRVLMITNYEDKDIEVQAFQKGIKIFHRKPIDFELFKAQIKMLLDDKNDSQSKIEIGDLALDYDKRIMWKEGEIIDLTNKELRFMYLLMSSPGEVFSRNRIISFTNKQLIEPESGSVDTLVSRVRNKIGKHNGKEIIETVHRQGYRLNLSYIFRDDYSSE